MNSKGTKHLLDILSIALFAQLSSSLSPWGKTLHQASFRTTEKGTATLCSLHSSRCIIPSRLSLLMSSDEDIETSLSEVQAAAIEQFISTVQSTLEDGSFTAFTLKGPSVPRRKKSSSNEDKANLTLQKEKLRGKYKLITGRLVMLQEKEKKKQKKGEGGASNKSLYLQANIKFHLATDVAQNWKVTQSKLVDDTDEVLIGLRRLFATAMGFVTDENADTSKLISEWGVSNNDQLGILNGEVATTRGIYKLVLQPERKGKTGFFKTKQKLSQANDTFTQKALAHDKQRNTPLSPSSLFFQKLGVTNADGKPKNGMASKLRQCQKFVEIVGKLVDDYVSASSNDSRTVARLIDMGCGRGYLTFSLHSYLCTKYLSLDDSKISSVETQGIDRRPKLIQEINGIASDLGRDFNSLKFVEGTIGITEDNLLQKNLLNKKEASPDSDVNSATLDILIALHACDTATDDAIWYAIERNADIIVTAPCCQHELRPQIDRHASMLSKQKNPLNEILCHAIYRERHTEIVTDAIRAMLLDIAGYDTQVFEFIGGEHTAKNVMITAVKRYDASESNSRQIAEKRRRLVELAEMYGVTRQRLASLMNESIGADEKHRDKTASGMPAL